MKPRVLIAGAGQTGRALCARLAGLWEVVVIDRDPRKSSLVLGGTFHEGDATSALVVRQAGMEGAAAAIAVTDRDEVNLEFCRLAREIYKVPRVLSSTRRSEPLADFEKLGVLAISRPDSVASLMESRLEQVKRTTADVGLGQGEILEVTVLPNSPVIGKSMLDLSPQAWLVAAIYRRGELVVPHGQTQIEEGDRVLLVGDPALLPAIADYFRAGESEFPLQFGKFVGLAHPDGRAEAEYLAENTKALGICTELTEAGCLVLNPAQGSWMDNFNLGRRAFFQQLESARVPVLLARGSFPYGEVVVGVGPREVELAIDVARVLGLKRVTAVAVQAPTLVTGAEKQEQLQAAMERAVKLGQLYRLRVEPVLLQGNPVRQMLKFVRDFKLLVLAHRRHRGLSLTRPDVSRLIMLQSPISTLVTCHGS